MRARIKQWFAQIALTLAALTALPVAQAQTVEYIHTDALGSVVAVTDQNKQVLERREYEPYGDQISPSAKNDGPNYTGHVLDSSTGLIYAQQRYYDQGIGRFLSVDPVGADGGTGGNFNRYKYAGNNPYRFIDPDGRWDWEMFARGVDEAGDADQGPMFDSTEYTVGNLVSNVSQWGMGGYATSRSMYRSPARAMLKPELKGGPAKPGPVKPGQAGTYGELKAQKKAHGETEKMDMDHQPSYAAQVASRETALGRKLTPAERASLKANTPAVASPQKIHQQTSPTYGGRNTPARIAEDAADLEKAAARDRATFEEAMRNR